MLLKAAAGGGGKGIRIANDATEFDNALHEAMTEAERSFGDSAMIARWKLSSAAASAVMIPLRSG